jgi:hypothetical protein
MATDIKPMESGVFRKAPDPILAELWEIKRQINEEAGYQVEVVAQRAHEAAILIRQQMAERAKTGIPPSQE